MPDQFPESALPGESPSAGIDVSVPHSARIWNYWLGGQDHYAVDRRAGDEFIQVYPGIVDVARGPASTSTLTPVIRARSWPRPRARWISPAQWR
jgi:S-adenosyl methyltransferase